MVTEDKYMWKASSHYSYSNQLATIDKILTSIADTQRTGIVNQSTFQISAKVIYYNVHQKWGTRIVCWHFVHLRFCYHYHSKTATITLRIDMQWFWVMFEWILAKILNMNTALKT